MTIRFDVPIEHEKPVWPEMLSAQREHISATQITMAMRCLEQYRQRYVLGNKAPPGAALVLGGGVGRAVEAHLGKYIVDHVGLSIADTIATFAEAYEERIAEEGGLMSVQWRSDGYVSIPMARRMAAADKDLGVRMTSVYRKEVAPTYQDEAVAVEASFEITDPSWLTPLKGYIDVEKTSDMVELKTSARKNSAPSPEWIAQAGIYQIAKPKPLYWHQLVKTKTPQVIGDDEQMMYQLEPWRHGVIRRLVRSVQEAIVFSFERYGPDEPWEGTGLTHPWACGFCGYRPGCFWWGSA